MPKTEPELFRMASQSRNKANDVDMTWDRGYWQLTLSSVYHIDRGGRGDRSAWNFEIGLWYMESTVWTSRPTPTRPIIRIDRRVPAVMAATWLVNKLNNAVYLYIKNEWMTFVEQFGWEGWGSTVTLTDEDVASLYRKSNVEN